MYLHPSNLKDDVEIFLSVAHKVAPNLSLYYTYIYCSLVKIGENGHILDSYPIASKILSPASWGDLKRLNNRLNEEVKNLPLLFDEGFVKACEDLIYNFKD